MEVDSDDDETPDILIDDSSAIGAAAENAVSSENRELLSKSR